MNTNSNVYTVVYTTIVVVVVAAVLAFAAMQFKPRQIANVKAETLSQMMAAAQLGQKEELSAMGNDAVLAKYAENIDKIARYLESAATMTIKESVRNYLLKRAEALRTDDYYESDLAWMDMKDSKMDLVIGPIEDYEDGINGVKTAYECFILLKDLKKTDELTKYIAMLPDLQKELPPLP